MALSSYILIQQLLVHKVVPSSKLIEESKCCESVNLHQLIKTCPKVRRNFQRQLFFEIVFSAEIDTKSRFEKVFKFWDLL